MNTVEQDNPTHPDRPAPKLRVVAGLDQGAQDRPDFAQGGAGTPSRTALMDTVQHEAGRLADLVNRDIEVLGREIISRERSFRELKTLLDEKRSVLASTPTIWPVKGLITAGYGYRQSPFTGAREMHEGCRALLRMAGGEDATGGDGEQRQVVGAGRGFSARPQASGRKEDAQGGQGDQEGSAHGHGR